MSNVDRSLPTSTARPVMGRALMKGANHIIVGMNSLSLRISERAFGMDPRGLPAAEVFADPIYGDFIPTLDAVYADGIVRSLEQGTMSGVRGEAVMSRWCFEDGSLGVATSWRASRALETPARQSRLPAHAA